MMRFRRGRGLAVAGLLALVSAGFFAGYQATIQVALAGHTAGLNGNCWRGADPLMCRTTWDCTPIVPTTNYTCPDTQAFPLQLIDGYTDGQPAWAGAAHMALDEWNLFAGPWDFRDYHRTGDSNIYLYDSVTGSNGLGSSTFGVTWNCNTSGSCVSRADVEMDIYFTKIYFNRDKMNSLFIGDDDRANVFAHEIGHAMGLFHHSSTSALMYPGQQEGLWWPTSIERGSATLCSSTSTYGLRCIYELDGD